MVLTAGARLLERVLAASRGWETLTVLTATSLVFYVLGQEALWGKLDGYMYFGIKTNRMSVYPTSQAEKLDSDMWMASRDGQK
jgi:hypothetical protein